MSGTLLAPPRDGEGDHAAGMVEGAPPRGPSPAASPLHPPAAPGGPPPRAGAELKFQIGARTLWTARRRVRRVALSLDAALSGQAPALPPLAVREQGYLLTSLPAAVSVPAPGLLVHIRQRYRRYWVDVAAGEAAWWSGLSANARSQLKRKEKKLLAAGAEIRRYRTPDGIADFHPLARRVSAQTYQERLLDSGLPDDPTGLLGLAAADRVRAWLLLLAGEPIAYLCCTGEGGTLRYDHVGHLPDANAYAPGTVLQLHALRDLFADGRWTRVDFTEGEGQHKRQLATGGVDCVDLLLLRPTPGNRALLAAMWGFDAAVALAKRAAPWLRRFRR